MTQADGADDAAMRGDVPQQDDDEHAMAVGMPPADDGEQAMPGEAAEPAATRDQYAMPPPWAESAAERGGEHAMPPAGDDATASADDGDMPAAGAEPRADRAAPDMPGQPKAVRLTFVYEDDDVRLVSRQPIEAVVPPTDPVTGYEAESGFWLEVRGRGERTLHRKVMQNPFRRDVEVFSPEPGENVARTPVESASGSFSVVVPDIDEADHVALLSSGRPDEAAPGVRELPAQVEVARFSLHDRGEAE